MTCVDVTEITSSPWTHTLDHRTFNPNPGEPCLEKTPRKHASVITVYRQMTWLAVWLSGNALASINVVALRQTRLVLGWVTVCGRVNHFGM